MKVMTINFVPSVLDVPFLVKFTAELFRNQEGQVTTQAKNIRVFLKVGILVLAGLDNSNPPRSLPGKTEIWRIVLKSYLKCGG